jgi:LysM repeat protein
MGLFSFIKNAGANLFGNKEKEAAKKRLEEEQKEVHENAVLKHLAEKHVNDLGLHVTFLDIIIDDALATVKGEAADQATREKVVLAVGNVGGIEQVDDQMTVAVVEDVPAEPVSQFHTVVKGDTLGKIAKHYYGNAMKYPEIFEANKPMLKDPDLIYPGQVLRIPDLNA